MAGRWTTELQVEATAGERAACWSRIVVHTVMLTIVLALAAAITLATVAVAAVTADSLQEALTPFEWPTLDDLVFYFVEIAVTDFMEYHSPP
jgi:hypothetical protein